MMHDPEMFQGFTRRSKTLISVDHNKKKSKMLTLLKKVNTLYPQFVMESLQSLNRLTQEKVDDIVTNVPSSIMSLLHKEWVRQLILYRIKWLSTELEGKENDE